jgi:hypothetical protein
MHELILQAVNRTFGFRGWSFANEFEIKHELFHQLALKYWEDVSLASIVTGSSSCRLHAEGKVLNGRPQKADLLICDPSRPQAFNYEVSRIIEIKTLLSDRMLMLEIEKFSGYARAFDGLYLVALSSSRSLSASEYVGKTPLYILTPDTIDITADGTDLNTPPMTLENAIHAVREVIDSTLLMYGEGRDQYQSFFWCNYEHETSRRHSFPCEGDFNAQLYHGLRKLLPSSVEIRSEQHPPHNSKQRIDFVIKDRAGSWAIPLDVKMNWDQFKPAFRNGLLKTAEATTILERLNSLRTVFPAVYPMVIVIQGEWRILSRDIRSKALPVFEESSHMVELSMFNEVQNKIERKLVGNTT